MGFGEKLVEALTGLERNLRLAAIGLEGAEEIGRAHEKHGSNADLEYGNDAGGTLLAALVKEGDLDVGQSPTGGLFYYPSNYELELAARKVADGRCAAGRAHTRLNILLEEVFEAAATNTNADLRKELIQVIAMAMDWVADIDAEEAK